MDLTLISLALVAEEKIQGAMARVKLKPPCCAGCFQCCRESVLSDTGEVSNMLESLTQEQREAMKPRAAAWREKFMATGMQNQTEPKATEYRPHFLWCPALDTDTGKCMTYEHRPMACRFHIAQGNPEACKDEELRKTQKFALFPGLMENLLLARINHMKGKGTIEHDHLGILLHNALNGATDRTHASRRLTVEGNTITMEQHAEEQE